MQLQELQNQINSMQEQLMRMRSAPSATVEENVTAIGTYRNVKPQVIAEASTRQVWL